MTMTRMETARGPRPAPEGTAEISAQLARVDQDVRAFVKERPILSFVGALAAGYVVGRILRRRG